MKVVFNGKIIDEKEATIPISDKGYFYDFAVYSSLKVIQGKVFFPEFHIERLFESAKQLDLHIPQNSAEIRNWLQLVIKENALTEALLRIIVIGDAEKNEQPKFFIFPVTGVTFYPRELYTSGAKVITYTAERRLPTAKSKDLLLSFMAMREAIKQNAIESLLIDNDGNIREGTRSNFYAVKDTTIILPPQKKVLEGIVQKIVLDLIKGHFNVLHEDIPLSRVIASAAWRSPQSEQIATSPATPNPRNDNYTEFFLTSTLFNIMPIGQIDDQKINSDFKVTKEIMKLYKDYYKKEVLEK